MTASELPHQLAPHLRRLRLSGILDTLEVRTQQAITEQWSYVEFLARLIQDEAERREHKRLEPGSAVARSIPPRPWSCSTSASIRASTASRSSTSPPAPSSASAATP